MNKAFYRSEFERCTYFTFLMVRVFPVRELGFVEFYFGRREMRGQPRSGSSLSTADYRNIAG
jgi:hypothetical protein